MLLRSTMLTVVVLAAVVSSAMGQSKILVVGDSNGEYSCDYIQSLCGGSTVINEGIGGSTAQEWATNDYAANALQGERSGLNAPVTGLTHVWITLLGNDWMGTGCSVSSSDLATTLTSAYTTIKNAVEAVGNTDVQYVLTSYCNPRAAETCNPGVNLQPIQDAMTAVAAAQGDVTFVDIGTACGGSNTQYSDPQFFADAIHLNARGYCAAFGTTSALQTALGCTAAEYNCCAVTGQLQPESGDPPTCSAMTGLASGTGDCNVVGGPTPDSAGTSIAVSFVAAIAAGLATVAVPNY